MTHMKSCHHPAQSLDPTSQNPWLGVLIPESMHHLQDKRGAAPQDFPRPIQPYELREELVPGLCPCIGLPKCG